MQPLSKQQQQYLEEQFVRAGAFEEMIRTKGWELVLAYYTNALQAMTNGLMLHPEKPIEDFRDQRNELIGLRKLISNIDNTLTTVREYREKNPDGTDEK